VAFTLGVLALVGRAGGGGREEFRGVEGDGVFIKSGKSLGRCGDRDYVPGMTATAEHVLEELKTLPQKELRTVWEQAGRLLRKPEPLAASTLPPPFDPPKAAAALAALSGKFAGAGLSGLLLQERAKDRLREQAELEKHLAHRRSPGHGQA